VTVSGAAALYKIGQAFSVNKGSTKQYKEALEALGVLAKDRKRAPDLVDAHPTSIYTPDIEAKLEIVDIEYKAFEKHLYDYDGLHTTLTASETSRRTLLKIHRKYRWRNRANEKPDEHLESRRH
jgi:hypothetical protein